MRLPRFFIPPDSINGEHATLRGPIAHQIRNVLRLRAGDHLILLDNSGSELEVELESLTGDAVSGRVVARHLPGHEPRVKLALYQALLKLDKFEWVLQKGTELGITAFHPLICERVVRVEVSAKKLERWQRIVREAAEQSERAILPHLYEPIAFERAVQVASANGLSIIPYEQEHTQSLRACLQQHDEAALVNLFIGPEGGFSEAEIASARQHNLTPVTLGPRILRADTAGLVAASAILYQFGEMG